MSADLLEQLGQYGADHRARQVPVERHEILARVHELTEFDDDEPIGKEPPAPPRYLLVAATALVLVLVAGLVLVIVGRDSSEPSDVPGTDLIRSTEPSVPSTNVEPSPTTSSSTTTTIPSEPGVDLEIPSIGAQAVFGEPIGAVGTAFTDGARHATLEAWRDGFLSLSVVGGLQMAVELSDEMFSRLPIEVQEAYPEQLEGSLGEVTARLQEDGLLDEVQAALEADPELEAAVRSGPTTPVELVAEFTVDGDAWTPVDLAAPANVDVEEVFVVGDRLVAVGMPSATLTTPLFRSMVVASTQDLVSWSIQTVPDVVETLSEVSIAANEVGWVAHIEPDLCRRDETGVGCGWPPEPSYGYDVGEGPPLTWAAAWGAEPAAVDGAVAAEGVTLLALQNGFLAQHDELESSPDGLTWEPVVNAPPGFLLEGSAPLDDGSTAVFGFADTCESEIYRVDETGRVWERIALDIEGAGTSLLPNTGRLPLQGDEIGARSSLTSALLVDDSGPIVSTGVIEQDGRRLILTECFADGRSSNHYELVDVRTGDVVVAEDSDGWTTDPNLYNHLIDDDEILTVTDPATDEKLVTFDRTQMEWIDVGVGGADEVWLLATVDGLEWVVDNLSSFGAQQRFFIATARNGDKVLVGSGDGWLRYDLDVSGP